MRIKKVEQIDEFLKIVDESSGDVWLESKDGDKFNLKSRLAQYVAIGMMLREEGDNLELFCSKLEDQAKFFEFFSEHPETV